MKKILYLLALFTLPLFTSGQESRYLDSLKQILNTTSNDTIKMDIYRKMGFYLQNGHVGEALDYHKKQLEFAKKLNMKLYEADAYEQMAYVQLYNSDLSNAYNNYIKGLKIAEDPHSGDMGWGYSNFSYSKSPKDARLSVIGMINYELSNLYQTSRMEEEQRRYLIKAKEIGEELHNQKILSLTNRDLGIIYNNNKQPDSALAYYKESLSHYKNSPYITGLGNLYQLIGEQYASKQQYDSSLIYLKKAINTNIRANELISLSLSDYSIARVFQDLKQLDSTLQYTVKGVEVAKSIDNKQNLSTGYLQLSGIYKSLNKPELALKYSDEGRSISDSLTNAYQNKLIQMQNLGFEEQLRLKKVADDQMASQNRLKMIGLIAVIAVILFIALFLYRINRQKQKTNTVLEKMLTDLKATQTQLIQSEKMASLGELTAGIAHEIQNPLNFVNNFSEVNKELSDEIVEEAEKGNIVEIKIIAQDIKENSEKINHHGKRADAIVKGMLQHSRASAGIKEPTDINVLTDEYFRLAYHGLRAKDKSFNATMKTDFDKGIGKIDLIAQDIGRVVLNLINNAFYTVNEKKKQVNNAYEPTVSVNTKKLNDKIEISVADNGNGIPQKVVDKIFQPFFTTKPSGQGTGLGLSLSYDIVKAHGGELKVETKEGEGTKFTILLNL